MSRRSRSLYFWGKNAAENLALILAGGLILALFSGMGLSPDEKGGWEGVIRAVLTQYPFYILLIGGFLLAIAVSGYVKSYIPVLVALNCPRKKAVLGSLLSMLSTILAMAVVCALIWSVVPQSSRWILELPLLTGGVLAECGIAVFAGGISFRKAGIGTKMFVVLSAVFAGILGMAVSISVVSGGQRMLNDLIRINPWVGMFGGIVIFAAGSCFCLWAASDLEVQV